MEQDQNNMPPTQEPIQNNAFPNANAKTENSNYALMGGLIGIAIIALGAWYMMMKDDAPLVVVPVPSHTTRTTTTTNSTTTTQTVVAPDTATAAFQSQGTSDQTSAIDADLKSTNTSSLNDINKI